MKTKMQQTSLEAYESILDNLQPKEQKVVEVMADIQPCSNQEIARALGWEINRVTGRTNKLVEKGIVMAHDKAKNSNGRMVIRWRLTAGTTQLTFF